MKDATDSLDVLHVTPRLGRCGGGVWQFVSDLALAQAESGQRVAVVGLDCDGLDQDAKLLRSHHRVELHVAKASLCPVKALGYSRDLERQIDALAARAKLIHAHGGLRMWTLSPVRRAAKRHDVPMLLAPHGGLYPWMLGRNRLKKRLLYHVLDRRNLAAVDQLHATCEQELGYCRDYGLTQPAAVVPPGVRALPEGDNKRFLNGHPNLRGKRLCGFLGYFDRKKGLLRLVRAWAKTQPDDWHLVIAGHNQGGHQAEVEAEIERLDMRDRVTILGPQMAQAKSDYLSSLDLFVLPTDWENFGVVLGEALSLGVPIVTTTNTPWQWIKTAGVGWFIEPTEEALVACLREATGQPRRQIDRAVVVQRLSWARSVERFGRRRMR